MVNVGRTAEYLTRIKRVLRVLQCRVASEAMKCNVGHSFTVAFQGPGCCEAAFQPMVADMTRTELWGGANDGIAFISRRQDGTSVSGHKYPDGRSVNKPLPKHTSVLTTTMGAPFTVCPR